MDAYRARLRKVLVDVTALDTAAPEFMEQFHLLQSRAEHVLNHGYVNKGNPTSLPAAQAKALEVRRAKARAFAEAVAPYIAALRNEGMSSFRQIAAGLNKQGISPQRGKLWGPQQVRAAELAAK